MCMSLLTFLDEYIPANIREALETQFYSKICQKAAAEEFSKDLFSSKDPSRHIALYSDHGVVHMRDVANRGIKLLDDFNGILFPYKEAKNLRCMKSVFVLLTYLHDIGMLDFSPFGREMHPQFASHFAFSSNFNSIVECLANNHENYLTKQLAELAGQNVFKKNLLVILREIASLAVCHSRSSVPIYILRDPHALRKTMQHIISTPLPLLHAEKLLLKTNCSSDSIKHRKPGIACEKLNLSELYSNFFEESYSWLVSLAEPAQNFVEDLLDALIFVRIADAFRQRGSNIKTSAGYQIFLNQKTGNAVFSLKKRNNQQSFLLEIKSLHSAGEANISASEFTENADLRFSFHQGCFKNQKALDRIVAATAFVVNDILDDVISSLHRPEESEKKLYGQIKLAGEIKIFIESIDSNPNFAYLVAEEIHKINPHLKNEVKIVPSLLNVTALEKKRYLEASEVSWDLSARIKILQKLFFSGHKTEQVDPKVAFSNVREVQLAPGEVLLEANSSPGFCYIPTDSGLIGDPSGGYDSFEVAAWTIVGATSVMRGSVRNATVKASKSVKVLMMPKETYLKYWDYTYTLKELKSKMNRIKNVNKDQLDL